MKKLASIVTILASFFIIQSLVISIATLWQKKDIVAKAQKQLQDAQKENEELKKNLVKVDSPEFLEEEARNKLFLSKPGENQVILPSLPSSVSAIKQQAEPNWQKWVDLFVKEG